MKKITPKNCRKQLSSFELIGDITSQAQAWNTVITFCRQNGMKHNSSNMSGIERVITFIDKKIKKANKLNLKLKEERITK